MTKSEKKLKRLQMTSLNQNISKIANHSIQATLIENWKIRPGL